MFGGHTKSKTFVKLDQQNFVDLDKIEELSVSSCSAYRLTVSFAAQNNAVAIRVGSILIGKEKMSLCCASAESTKRHSQGEMGVELGLCSRRVVALLLPVDTSNQLVIHIEPVDAMTLIDVMHVQFFHQPGIIFCFINFIFIIIL